MDADLRLAIEVLTLLGGALGLAMRIGSLKVAVEKSLDVLAEKVKELRDEAQAERKETRASLGALKDGQQALALAQGGDHVLLGELKGKLDALQHRSDEALAAQRSDIEKAKAQLSELRRDVDRLQGRTDRG